MHVWGGKQEEEEKLLLESGLGSSTGLAFCLVVVLVLVLARLWSWSCGRGSFESQNSASCKSRHSTCLIDNQADGEVMEERHIQVKQRSISPD